MPTQVMNFVAGGWVAGEAQVYEVPNPATAQPVGSVAYASPAQADRAVRSAHEAFNGWRRTPVGDRVQFLFKFKSLLEENAGRIARTITGECGKTLAESTAELRRGIENVETACGMPSLIQGYNNEDIATGVDEHLFRQPLGVVAAITPFNFPAMIPLWFLPYAIACGNCFVLKPSEKVPMTAALLIELLEQTKLPQGVVQLLHGGKEVVDALLDHREIQAVSFVGSTPVAKYIYSRATANGKRAQCQGGAKNPLVVLSDADIEMTTKIVADSAFGCAGQRCLAASLAITVGDARGNFTESITASAKARRVGNGLEAGVEMGPVISAQSKTRIEGLIEQGQSGGARIAIDGRSPKHMEGGNFLSPTVLDQVAPNGPLANTEIFGPVLTLMHATTLDDAIAMINAGRYGNMACLFTSSGAAARRFRSEVVAGNIGINIGVAAPMAFFPFSGWKDSFFGDLHAQGRHAVEFYTQTKVVVERWPKEWSRQF